MRAARKAEATSSAGAPAIVVAMDPATAAPEPGAGFRLKDADVERALVTGEHVPALEEYFGEAQYAELRKLASDGRARGVRGGPRVLILPGIMGSKLGFTRRILDDVLWIDPVDVALGNLTKLTLDGRNPGIQPLGVILFAYLKLKLTLRASGFDADFHPFDWRRDIAELGAELAGRIKSEGKDVWLVAHSMGGLVARAAMKPDLPSVKRLIMLGTPNYGSFVVPQALRGSYPLVRKIAALDLHHTPEALAETVFNSFPGLYQMLPWTERWKDVDLFKAEAWPKGGVRPRPELLSVAATLGRRLAEPAPERMVLIAGINQETLVGLKVVDGDFVYDTSYAGDGTVPLELARLPNVPTYFVDESHGSLPNNGDVASAVIDLLRGETTRQLPTTWTPTRASGRVLAEGALRVDPYQGRRGGQISQSERRQLIAELAAPDSQRSAGVAVPGAPAPAVAAVGVGSDDELFDHVVVGRRRQRRLDITLALGSITEVDARAYVLGIFRDVIPTGPAAEIDRRLDGAVSELTARRMLTGIVGQAFVMPIGRSTLRADMVLFAGLGSFDTFTPDVQQLVAENVVRVFARTHVEEFATLLLGAGSGVSVSASLANMLSGFLRALADTDAGQRFRRIIICERDEARYAEVKRALYQLAATSLFSEVEVTITEERLPATITVAESPRADRGGPRGADPIYLMVRQAPRDPAHDTAIVFDTALLGADGKAAVFTEPARFAAADLQKMLDRIESQGFAFDGLAAYGEALGKLVLPPGVRKLLGSMKERHVILVHDAPSSRVPWEAVHLRDDDGKEGTVWCPALTAGITRRYLAGNLSIAKWLETRRQDDTMDVLLVYNPTEDLPGAEREGERLRAALGGQSAVRIKEIKGRDANRSRLLDELRSGAYDVVHYAGHAFFDAAAPEKSGILCAGREVLTGADLASLRSLPSLAVFNACEAARIRRGGDLQNDTLAMGARLARITSFAEAFLRGGIANYVGTYWPVNDESAMTFSTSFYGALMKGATVSAALLASRRELYAGKLLDYADYIHYGSPDFVIKYGRRDAGATGEPATAAGAAAKTFAGRTGR